MRGAGYLRLTTNEYKEKINSLWEFCGASLFLSFARFPISKDDTLENNDNKICDNNQQSQEIMHQFINFR